jgi:hypothetical protein
MMRAFDLDDFQYVARTYRVVAITEDGTRTIMSRHDSFLSAERARKTIPSEDRVSIRIETSVAVVPARRAG